MNYELNNAHDLRLNAKYCDRHCYLDGGNNTTTTSASSAPSSFAQPYLTDLMTQGKALYNQGSQYAPFNTVNPFSPQTLQGLNMATQRAQNGSPVVNAANNSITNLLQSGANAPGSDQLTQLMQGYNDPGNAYAQQATGANAAMGQAGNLSQGGGPGASTMQQWADTNNINPYLDAQYKAASRPVIDSVNAQFSNAGRTGSVANQDAMTSRLGDVAANIYGTGYENAANRSLNAANNQQSNALQGTQLYGNLDQQRNANLLNAGNQLSSNALNQANVRSSAAQNLNSNALQRGNQQVTAAVAAPTLAGQDWTNIQNQLQAGQAYDTQGQNYINDALARWNFGQDQPWNLLAKYAGSLNGYNLGSTQTGTNTAPSQSAVPGILGAGVNLLSSSGSNGGSLFSNLLGY